MQTIILAGGLGTRLGEETASRPKPMVTVGGQPLLWHIMNLYARQGFDDFVLALGYQADWIRDYLLRLTIGSATFRVDMKTGHVDRLDTAGLNWRVTAVETGSGTQTGGRIKRAADYVNSDLFMITYGDGLADIDLHRLVEFHLEHDRLVTVTAVRAQAQFGYLDLDADGRVRRFAEKSQPGDVWVNGGFFVADKRVLDYIDGDHVAWEGDPLTRLTEEGELMAYRHEGFWHSMETQRDRRFLEDEWAAGRAPWRQW